MDQGTVVIPRRRIPALVAIVLFGVFTLPLVMVAPCFSTGVAPPCVVPDNGAGTADLPPSGCGYVHIDDVLRIINGLPSGSEIQISGALQGFFNITRTPGGSLGGETEQFGVVVSWHLKGTGSLSGFDRIKNMQLLCRTDSGPRTPGNPVQSFDTDFVQLQGQLPPGDPDFDLLRITAGTTFSMPSPGHTTLTRLPNTDWNVYSFFDITYRIDFVGSPGGPLAGRSGSTTGTIRFEAGQPVPTGVGGAPVVAATLEQNVPNPFNPTTSIEFVVPEGSGVLASLDIFDADGARVRSLVHQQPSSGRVQVMWDGRNDDGRRVGSGVYFYRLTAGAAVLTRRMVMVK